MWIDLSNWLQQYDVTLDLVTVWTLTVGFALFGIIKLVSWLVLIQQHDQTHVGRSLKWQKGSEAMLGLSMAALYSRTLLIYYGGADPSFPARTTIRLGVVVATILASVFGARFIWHLVRESRRTRQGAAPLAFQAQDGEDEGVST